ncbi:hypothetical protein [Streptomyces sp. NBC_00083]|uniref:hypothetical protein n=1 Tax=Streptomyces sp. NBC_00083 TaxID=2975647 RepID=UPI002253A39E|nr:hypothetical protein [Streptomyces sp. NBC_00083]MCX5387531.1 hypothetical protein [Streptomyces sp. NBC_00083]
MGDAVKPETLRSAIASAVAELKSYEVPAECVRLGLAPGEEGDAFKSKFRYVLTRLRPLAVPELAAVARKVVDEYDVPELEQILASLGMTGVDGEFKNLIFAANGPKPDIVLRDAVSNRLEIVRNAEYCLTYTRPLDATGLSWAALVDWWQRTHPGGTSDQLSTSQALCARLAESLASPPEEILFHTYAALYFREGGHALPALIPQVYLHYDPYTAKHRAAPGPLARQRMDFLLLLPNRVRVVLEVDGQQHYSADGKASPQLYAQMVSEDRQLSLSGYDVYRFGGHELDRDNGRRIVAAFFRELFQRYDIPLPPSVTG